MLSVILAMSFNYLFYRCTSNRSVIPISQLSKQQICEENRKAVLPSINTCPIVTREKEYRSRRQERILGSHTGRNSRPVTECSAKRSFIESSRVRHPQKAREGMPCLCFKFFLYGGLVDVKTKLSCVYMTVTSTKFVILLIQRKQSLTLQCVSTSKHNYLDSIYCYGC